MQPNVFEVSQAARLAFGRFFHSRLILPFCVGIARNQVRALFKDSDYAFDHRIAW
jgi:hypothetical protein